MQITDVDGRGVGVLVSGGLSSLALACWLHAAGHGVQAFVADLGQNDPLDLKEFAASLRRAGMTVHEADLRGRLGDLALDVVSYQGRYDGGYWNTTGLSREVLVAGLAPALAAAGCSVLVTGCVNGGNDQRRFERYSHDLAPELSLYSPWTDPEVREALPDRAAMARIVEAGGLALLPGNTAAHSTDGNLAGCSHEDATLEDLRTSASGLGRLMGVRPQDAPDAVRTVEIGVQAGRPVRIDGERLAPAELIEAANAVAGGLGLGLTDVVENRVNGTKCRGVYEAPGLELLSHAVVAAHQAATDRQTAQTFAALSRTFAESVYEGTLHRPVGLAARAGLEQIGARVDAVVRLEVYKGAVIGRSFADYGTDGTNIVLQRRFGRGGHSWVSHEAAETKLSPASAATTAPAAAAAAAAVPARGGARA